METHVEAFFVSRMWRLPGAAACCIALLVLFAGAARAQSGGEKTVLGLTDMIRMAVAFSPEMAEKRSASASAKSDLAQARAGFLPQIDTVGLLGPVNDAKRPEVAGNRIIDASSSYWSIGVFGKLNVMMTQPIYTFGKISNRRDAAEQGVAARQAQEAADGQRDRPTREGALLCPRPFEDRDRGRKGSGRLFRRGEDAHGAPSQARLGERCGERACTGSTPTGRT